jgi:methylase of polypeptide subunit release factors
MSLLDPGAVESIARFRQILEAQGYLGPKVAEILGSGFGPNHLRADMPLYLRRLAAPEPLNVLMKLFGLSVAVGEEEARAAFAPMTLADAAALGVLERHEGVVRATVGLVTTGSLVLARDRFDEATGALRADHVLGLNAPALNLARLTVRRQVRNTLDVGCGGGVQALLAAGHAARVVAVDISPRALAFTRFNAALNGVDRVECREGSFFAPVRGERFDLIVCNPPFTISPDSRYVFRDGGRESDAVCEEAVRGAAAHLEENGFATVLCNWALGEGDEPSAPPRRWVDGSGCDAWVLVSDVQDPLTYAAGWNRGARDYESALDRWVAYDRQHGIARIGMGAVILRRRALGSNWVRADDLPDDPTDACDAQIRRVFEGQDRLRDLESDEALFAEAFRVSEDHQVHEVLVPRDGGYTVASRELRLAGGLGFRGAADGHTLELLRRCDGRTSLREIVEEMAFAGDVAPDVLAAGVKGAVRRLVAMGFMLPVADRVERRKADGGSLEVA